jgi:beta-ketodecanoyl-[acyl-carrier-protein] synthase
VFREVVPMVAQMILDEAARLGIDPEGLRRLWLHQANAGMNRLISTKVLGHEANEDESPDGARYLWQHVECGLDHRVPSA